MASPPFARPMHWPSIPTDEAEHEWAQLRGWVEAYVTRFGVDSRTVPPCWYRHNAMVEALAALRDHEQASYEHPPGKDAAVAFLRAAADIGTLLREHAARSGCSAAGHRAETSSRPATDEADWRGFVDTDVSRRRIEEQHEQHGDSWDAADSGGLAS